MVPFSERGDAPLITVYVKPGCVQCRATVRALTRASVAFTTVDIATDAQARDFVMSLGYLQAPVVVCGPTRWSGFRPDQIARLTGDVA